MIAIIVGSVVGGLCCCAGVVALIVWCVCVKGKGNRHTRSNSVAKYTTHVHGRAPSAIPPTVKSESSLIVTSGAVASQI